MQKLVIQPLDVDRAAAAQALYENFDFPTPVEDADGWEYYVGTRDETRVSEWLRTVYLQGERPAAHSEYIIDGASTKVTFHVVFEPGSAKVREHYASTPWGTIP